MRFISRNSLIAISIVVCGLALTPARAVEGSAFRVTPIRVSLNSRASSALLTLSNESPEELRFQISAFEWSQQDGSGEMNLTPTKDVVFFPALLTLKSGEERKVRVGTTQKSGAVEKTYRIFFEELPPLQTPESSGAQVRIVTKLGVPIFVDADKTVASGDIANTAFTAGKLAFDVENKGNTHFLARSVRVVGLDAAGKAVFQKQREGWYILRNGFRRYDVDLTASECAQVRSVRIEVDTDIASTKPEPVVISSDYRLPEGSCGH